MELRYKSKFLDMIEIIAGSLLTDAPFDFGDNSLALDLHEQGMEIAANRDLWHVPPAETVFIQRKLAGLFLLATRLKARVNVNALMRKYIKGA